MQDFVTADETDHYLIDYLFDLNGYLILKKAVGAEDLAEMNRWVDDHWDYVEGKRRGHDRADTGAWIGHVETHTYSGTDGCNFQNIVEGGPVFRRLIDYPAWIHLFLRWINPINGVSIHENLLNVRGKGGYIGIHGGGALPLCYLTFRQENTGEWMVGQINVITALQPIGPGDGATTLIPGSHKSAIRHPKLTEQGYRSDDAAGNQVGMKEMYLDAGDILLFTDAICHGSAARTHKGYRRMILYRYSPRFLRSRFHYVPSETLWAALTEEQRAILDPIPPRFAPDQGYR
ncbi:MAG: phytanoyl-CoA dioxygenase family protein [candidate division Zixibacteria bacterium]|nr:phytanoyl-CoA dioxygenase family protein [candidate division Zixibacteria bacterium]